MRCKECGGLLFNTSKQYAVCENGCGGLLPAIPRDQHQMNSAIMLGLPEAKYDQLMGAYLIQGKKYRRDRKFTGSLDIASIRLRTDQVLAIFEGGVYKFSRDHT